ARAWAIKELAMSLWHYVSKTWARKGWEQWHSWAVRSRLDPIKEKANCDIQTLPIPVSTVSVDVTV
ncbi:MAG: transposase, partial [Pseudomonadota bacterium]